MMRQFCIAALSSLLCVSASHAVTVQILSTMDFGQLEGSGNNGNANLGTNGSISYTRSMTGSPSGVNAQILMIDDPGTVVEIGCRGGPDVTLPNGFKVDIQQTQFVIGEANRVPYNAAGSIRCRGANRVVATHTITGNASEDTIFVGGRFRGNNRAVEAGTYSSANPGGRDIRFRINVQ